MKPILGNYLLACQLLSIFFFSLSSDLVAMEIPEKDSSTDTGLAAVWMISQVAQGGYLKPALSFTLFDENVNSLWDIEAGWRFTNWFKFGAGLKRTLFKLERVQNQATLFGLIIGASGRNRFVGNFTFDLTLGSFDTGDLDKAIVYIEPGFHVRWHITNRLYWTGGISYRYVDNEPISLIGHKSYNSLSFKFALVNDKY